MYYGTDLKLKKSSGSHPSGKAAPRCGAAKGQGEGMGGYNASAVNKAMNTIVGGGGSPTYYTSGSSSKR